MSKDKREYDVFKGLLNGSQKQTLDAQTLLEVIRTEAHERLRNEARVYVLHDGSDIRKPESHDMENLGYVMSLDKKVVSGYKTMNSVAVDISGKELTLLEHKTYSTVDPAYLSKADIEAHLKKPDGDKDLTRRIEEGSYINNSRAYFQTVLACRKTIGRDNCPTKITHIQDREFDCDACFEYVDDLKDEFVTRVRHTRLSNVIRPKYTPKTGKLSKTVVYEKLKDIEFKGDCVYEIKRICLKNKSYVNVKCHVRWDEITINARIYRVVRVVLKDEKGQCIFEHPMLLVTNRPVKTAADAMSVYQAYLLRFKIEILFRFLKNNMGWETFQIRDFQSIKNLLAFAFFLVGYFKELSDDIQKHETYRLIAQIGGGKGIVSQHFLLKGFEKLVHFQQVQQLLDEGVLTREEINTALKNFAQT